MSTQPENSYIGRHAELYDIFYADKPYAEEAAFVHKCIQTHKKNARHIMELACGTGTHALLLEKYGYDIVACDYSPDMLAQAKEKARQANSRIDFRQQDMRLLNIPERPFDAIICLFDSIGYVASNEDISQVLDHVCSHLANDGIFIFEFWNAGAMLRYYDQLRLRRFRTSTGEVERISETTIDLKEQLCHVSYTINEFNDDGTYQTMREMQINRFFLVQEMSLFLHLSHLSPLKWFAGYSEDERIDQNTWHIVAVAQKDNHS
jgi:SAM-dependent methyltransferase